MQTSPSFLKRLRRELEKDALELDMTNAIAVKQLMPLRAASESLPYSPDITAVTGQK